MQPSLFERVGGENAVSAVAGLMYDESLNDAELRPFFQGVNMDAIVSVVATTRGEVLGR